MPKKLKNFFILIITLLLLNSCYNNDTSTPKEEDSNLSEVVWTKPVDSMEELEKTEKSTNDKLEEIKKKLNLKWLITKWDMYFEEKDYMIALSQYLKVLKEVPNDKEINMKIWNIYYALKKFSRAYDYYKKIKDYVNLDKKQAIYSLINWLYEWEWNLNYINEEIDSFWLTEQETFYYKNSLICTINYSKCRANFQEYFNLLNEKQIKIEMSDLSVIKETFTNYQNFWLEDLDYKSALVTWWFYKNGFYFVAFKTGEWILKQNSNYKPILKIVAKSAYELGDYSAVKWYLQEYIKLDDKDAEISYFMWRVYEKLGDKFLGSVHFTRAIQLWYPDVIDIKRRLIFIYFGLDETKKMLDTFKELIDSKDKKLNINDYNLAIYYHIANDDLETWKKYSLEWIQAFPNSELFYAYYAWIMLQKENLTDLELEDIKENIEKSLEINKKNTMITMVEWIYYYKTEVFTKAIISFKNAISLDTSWEFREEINYWLEKITKWTNTGKQNEK